MIMDQPTSGEFYGCTNQLKCNGTTSSRDYENDTFPPDPFPSNYANGSLFSPDLVPSNSASTLSVNPEDSHEDFDFSDVVLKYISQMLMEEDIEEKACMFQESAALQTAEKSFYELLGEKYPPSPNNGPALSADEYRKILDENHSEGSSTSSTITNLADPRMNSDSRVFKNHFASQAASSSSCSASSGNDNIVDRFVDSEVSMLKTSDLFSDCDSVMQFKRGFEEASKFIPSGNDLTIDLETNGLLKDMKNVVVTVEKETHEIDFSRGKKNPHPENVDIDGERSTKQSSIYTESSVRSEMFDMVLLNCGQSESALRESLQNGTRKYLAQNGQSKGSNGKSRGKKKGSKKGVVDLRTLLTLCAQSIATNDRRNATELLKQIRNHASPTGDGMQRMAHYFADGLEARLAGSGTQIYNNAHMTKLTSASDVLKAYHLLLAACPFRKLWNFFSNKTIMNAAEKATKLHIIDFGILYGFQWPSLIQRLASRPNGPPKLLRITGIDFPQPGFRPAQRVEETGRRLENYAGTFKIPFGFNAIAQKWDTIKIEDLKLDNDEVLLVNCQYRFRNLLDETVVLESPRDVVLNLIRKMNPDVFILGIVNGSYSAPFFITRFREALFHFSTLFDMLETNIPREIPERTLIEKDILGWEAMNVIACEGSERIERPETYKQWQVRNLRAGFKQLPLNREIVNIARDKVETCYHKDFVIDEDCEWLLQGWKGRIVYALSTWRPVN